MNFRALILALAALFMAAPARALEQINAFEVHIEVETDGDILVTESINVTAEGSQIQRGIFRDLPRFYESEGDRLPFQYHVLSVRRDGHDEPFDTSNQDNALRVRIGDPEIWIEHGAHAYELRYQVKNQLRYFERYDEIYWNATGTFWEFPIARARAIIVLPPGARITGAHGYTGAMGETGSDYVYAQQGDRHIFETTRPLGPREGLTVALGFDKGLIDPPSSADQGWLWWRRNGALAVLLGSLAALFWFLYRSFERVGRDPQKGPVFPRYDPPQNYPPAGAHHIYYRALVGHQALIATLMHLAVKGRLSIDATDKKSTTLTLAAASPASPELAEEELALERGIFAGSNVKVIGKKYDSAFTAIYTAFGQTLSRKYGHAYFKWNLVYTLLALALTIAAIVFAASNALSWTIWHTIGVLALAALNAVFLYLMPAPTPIGQQVRTEIEGFRLYMETAEKLQLNAAEPGGQAPPPMTTERYEKFLPYAVALGVEKPWTRHFERLIPEQAAAYHPVWALTGSDSSRSVQSLNAALMSSMSSGVTTAMPQSSGSSGSGGGGSSGGGGGGGGGGGW